MRLSVILSTYNAPAWLEKVIWGYAVQTYRRFDLIVADDGSTPDTAALVTRLARETRLRIHHVWHEDRGFRKCEILNKAIAQATAEYLVFSDGDCVPRKDFLETHAMFARPRRFLSGGLLRLPMSLSQRITVGDITGQRATSLSWLARNGLSVNKKWLLVTPSQRLGAVLDGITTTRPTWNGHNASAWREDLLEVNGFDERMGYGGEDRELGERLVNAGLRPHQIRHRAICVHLDHPRGYVDARILAWNQQHRELVRSAGHAWTEYGIRKVAEPQPDDMIFRIPAADDERPRKAA